jgi:hypothetical protein
MIGGILTNVMTKDVLMSRKIGFGKGQGYVHDTSILSAPTGSNNAN